MSLQCMTPCMMGDESCKSTSKVHNPGLKKFVLWHRVTSGGSLRLIINATMGRHKSFLSDRESARCLSQKDVIIWTSSFFFLGLSSHTITREKKTEFFPQSDHSWAKMQESQTPLPFPRRPQEYFMLC